MMNKMIVTEPSADIRKLSRQSLSGCWKTAILTVLLVQLVLRVPELLLTALFPSGALSAVLNLYMLLVGAPLTLGLTMAFLNIVRKKPTGPVEVFYGFEYLFKAIGLQFMVGLFTFLWTLLLVVPGLVAIYRYRLAFYILADDPSKGIMQCISESKYLMDGNKAKMFWLEFSFIGWGILCALPPAIFGGIFAVAYLPDSALIGLTQQELMFHLQQMPEFVLGVTLTGVGYVFLEPYISASVSNLYDLINGNLTICRVSGSQNGMGKEPLYSTTTPPAGEPGGWDRLNDPQVPGAMQGQDMPQAAQGWDRQPQQDLPESGSQPGDLQEEPPADVGQPDHTQEARETDDLQEAAGGTGEDEGADRGGH